MGRALLRAGVALLLALVAAIPAEGTTLPDYAVTKLDAHFSTLGAVQSLLDLVMGRDSTNGTANTSTTRWSYFTGNVYNLSRILVANTLGGAGGADIYAALFDSMANDTRCRGCPANVSTALAIIANNSSYIYGDIAGSTGRGRLWREWGAILASTDPANYSRNITQLVRFESSILRDAIMLYTENLKQTYSILGI